MKFFFFRSFVKIHDGATSVTYAKRHQKTVSFPAITICPRMSLFERFSAKKTFAGVAGDIIPLSNRILGFEHNLGTRYDL